MCVNVTLTRILVLILADLQGLHVLQIVALGGRHHVDRGGLVVPLRISRLLGKHCGEQNNNPGTEGGVTAK